MSATASNPGIQGTEVVQARGQRALFIITAIFVLTLLAAWAWFHVAPPVATERLRFDLAETIPEWSFEDQPIGSGAREILATTNLVNGVFTATTGRRVTAFAAEWPAADERTMSVVQHTPDICWVGSGWKAIDIGQPEETHLSISDRSTPFQCRVFSVGGGSQRELVVWCTLLSGEVLQESGRWQTEDQETEKVEARQRALWSARRVATGQLVHNVLSRRSGTGEKQFVRFSAPVVGSWQETLAILQDFAPRWLALHVEAGHP